MNPILIPRNHQVEKAIQDATNGNLSTFQNLTDAWKNPFLEPQDSSLEKPPLPHEQVKQTFCGT